MECRLGAVKGLAEHVGFIEVGVQCGWNTRNVKDSGRRQTGRFLIGTWRKHYKRPIGNSKAEGFK